MNSTPTNAVWSLYGQPELCYDQVMDRPTTADEALTLLTELPLPERVRLVRLIVAEAGSNDAMAYEAMPVGPDEFLYNKDAMAWDAEGWEEYY